MQTAEFESPQRAESEFRALFNFTLIMFQANTRHLQTLVLNLGTPLAIASMFLLTPTGISAAVVPLLFLVSLVFAGVTLGVRIIGWRDQKIFRRLAVTTLPLDSIVFGLFVSQLAVSITQGLILLIIISLMGVSFTFFQLIVMIWAIVLASFCFTPLGIVLATLIKRADMLNYAYLFAVMPMTLISGLLGASIGQPPLETIIRLMPTTMLVNLLNVVHSPITVETIAINSAGLLLYSFSLLTVVKRSSRSFIS